MEPREAVLICYWLDRYVPRRLFDAACVQHLFELQMTCPFTCESAMSVHP